MSDVGKRVKLVEWPYDTVGLKVGALGRMLSESERCIVVKWDCLSGPLGMRREELALTY